jgi:predicted glycosyltransferase
MEGWIAPDVPSRAHGIVRVIGHRWMRMPKNGILWFDIVNPSDVWFFEPIIEDLMDYQQKVTFRHRAETIALADSAHISGRTIGRHETDRALKYFSSAMRLNGLYWGTGRFDVGFSFENGLAMLTCKMKGRRSLLFCDNDLKLKQSNSILQDVENWTRSGADRVIIPSACNEAFSRLVRPERIVTYDGFKEDIYIADYLPDPDFHTKLPVRDYVVVRPEALDSSYVSRAKSLVPSLLNMLSKEGVTTVYLPRERHDREYSTGYKVVTPATPLNGLDLCYHSRAILTGSGTMAREAACMGIPAISFFPSAQLLSVDQKMVDEGRMIHSRDPKEILEYVLSNSRQGRSSDFQRSKAVKTSLIAKIRTILEDFGY